LILEVRRVFSITNRINSRHSLTVSMPLQKGHYWNTPRHSERAWIW
jgi:hypothetical protein